MSRFESGQFPISSASKMGYVKAASALGRMDQVDIQARRVRNGSCCGRRVWLGFASRWRLVSLGIGFAFEVGDRWRLLFVVGDDIVAGVAGE